MENGRMALKQKKASIFVIFGTSMMILHNTTLQRPFPKLKKHHPTNLYMLYPMAQSVLLVCIEIDKKMTLQWHCPSSLENPLSIIIRNHSSIQILNFDFIFLKILRVFTVGAANNTPACQQEALPARYRRTASLSTYTDTVGVVVW
jgi:hypothetical protein